MSLKKTQGSLVNKHFLSGSIWALSGKIFTTIAQLLINALLAHLLAPEELGVYFLIFSVVNLAALLIQLGMPQVAVRYISASLAKQTQINQLIKYLFSFCFISACIVSLIFIFFAGDYLAVNTFHSETMLDVMQLAVLWAVVLAFQALSAEIFRGFNDIRFATVFGGLINSIIISILFASLWVDQGHTDVSQVIILSIASGFGCVITACFLIGRKANSIKDLTDHDNDWKTLWVVGWPILLTNIIFFALLQSDIWILGIYASKEEVGIYASIARLAMIISVLLMIINAVVSPLIAEFHAKEKLHELELTLRPITSLAFLCSFFGMSFFIVFGADTLALLFGEKFSEGWMILVLLSVANLVKVFGGSCGVNLLMTGHQMALLMITVISSIMTIGLSLILVETYRGEGIASALIVGFFIQNLISVLYTKKVNGIWTHADIGFIINVLSGKWHLSAMGMNKFK